MAQVKVQFNRGVEGATNIVDAGTEGTKVASGTTAQRGSTTGQFRFNTTTNLAEYYTGTEFKAIDSPPTVTSVTPTEVDSSASGNESFTISGSNFQSGAVVKFIDNNGTEITADTVTINSGSSITAVKTRSSFSNSNEPYDVKVINTSGLSGTLDDQINIDAAPSWSTASGQIGGTIYENERVATFSATATDPDGDTISYSVNSGSLPSGLSLNTANGNITGLENSGSISADTTSSYTLRATAGSKTTDRAFTTVIKDDPSLAYTSNLKFWFKGGYNGRSATSSLSSNVTGSSIAGVTCFTGYGTTELKEDTGQYTPVNSASNTFIRDSADGSTKLLQDDKLSIYSQPNSTWWWTPTSSIFANTTNHTFTWWMKWDNVSAVTSSGFNPIFHSWGGTNAVAWCALDWNTNGTSLPYMNNFVGGGLYGTWNMSSISGGVNGNKGIWFHVAQVYSSGQTLCYLNGQLDATLTAPTSGWGSIGSNQVCAMNSRGDGYSGGQPGSANSGSDVPKYVADVRYYNTNISAQAVQAIYNKARVLVD
tara:strand:- start:607 stop:2220 length:1614 start_codon:yes stop_codon:yes gene_type:complete